MKEAELVDKIMELIDEAIGWLDEIDIEANTYTAIEDAERASELLHKAYSLLEELHNLIQSRGEGE